ncbi:reverse transcriptase domain-containing protein [Tanacetum coccineum]
MPFGLKNAGATYQRLVDKAFQKQIGRNLEEYVDDPVIKSRTEHEIMRDIEETFKTLREINMKLNPKKCTFEIEEGIFLGYKVNTKGIKVCPDKVEVVLSLPSPKCLKETAEAEVAFKQMKQLIAKLPTLAAPTEKEELIVYLAAAREAVLSRLEVTGRLQKWSIELGEYDIHYRPITSVKGQILANFTVERPEDDPSNVPMEAEEELLDLWILFTDGSSCVDGSGAGLILTNPEGAEFTYTLRFRFDATNNESEYEALIAGLRIAKSYIAKELGMVQYLEKVKALTSSFKKFTIKQVPRSENKKADALSKIASTSFAHLTKQVLVEELKEKSINEVEVLAVVEEEGNTWMTLSIFTSWRKPSLRKRKRQGPYGYACQNKICGSKGNTDRILLANNTCGCKENDLGMSRLPGGAFSEGPGKVKFLIVAIDYFTKWIKAKPVATITGNQIKKFVWDNIVCMFGLPSEIISYNGKRFKDNPFKDWCEKLCIRQHFTSVKHPQANTFVERANRSLGEGVKARLDERSKD